MLKFIKKVLKFLLTVFLCLLLAALLVLWYFFGDYIMTIGSIRKVKDANLYTISYHGDYHFDEFLEIGASTNNELLSFLWEALPSDLPIELSPADFACTAYTAVTKDGHPLVGRNLDIANTAGMLVRTNPKDGYRSISMAALGFIGQKPDDPVDTLKEKLLTFSSVYMPLDGINEKGLSVSVLVARNCAPTSQQTDKVDITTTTAIRLLLDKAATVNQAIDLLGQYDMHSANNTAYHFLIADALGNSAVVEYINNEMVVFEDERVCANFLLETKDNISGLGYDRYWIVRESLDETGAVISPERAMELLEAARWQEPNREDTSTQWSCVYDLRSKSVDIVMHEDWNNVLSFKVSRFPFF